MTVSTLDVDRNISTLRLNSQEFANISNTELSQMFLTSIAVSYTHLTLPTNREV